MIKNFNNIRVRSKLVLVFTSIIILSIVMGLLMFSFTNTARGGSHLSGIVGHEEVLIVDMALKVSIMHIQSESGVYINDPESFSVDVNKLSKVRAEFEEIFIGLKDGDATYDLAGFSDAQLLIIIISHLFSL